MKCISTLYVLIEHFVGLIFKKYLILKAREFWRKFWRERKREREREKE